MILQVKSWDFFFPIYIEFDLKRAHRKKNTRNYISQALLGAASRQLKKIMLVIILSTI